MMRKKMLAALTALACALSAMPVFTASALSWEGPTDYMVTEVQTNINGSVTGLTLLEIGGGGLSTLSNCGANMNAVLEGQKTPEWGDIISLSVPDSVAEIYPGCLHYSEENPAVLVNHGNITEIGVLEYFTIVGHEEYNGRITQCQLEDENNDVHLYYPDEEYGIPAPDVTESKESLYYMYNGEVVLLADEAAVDPWDVPWTATGIIIGPNLIDLNGAVFFDKTVDSSGDPIGAGDVVELKLRGGIAESYPGHLCTVEHIDRLGTAAELYGYEEYTVTENTGTLLSLTDEAGEEAQYSYYLQAEMGHELYNSELVINAQAGDVITFMDDENGSPTVPVDPEDLESRTEFVVIGVDDPDDPQNYIIIESSAPTHVYFMRSWETESYLANGGTPLSYGDIFTVAGSYHYTCIWGTNDIGFENAESIRIEGSVFDKAETAEFTTASMPYDSSFILLESTEEKYQYPVDFMLGTALTGDTVFTQPDGIDWAKPDLGDRITMYTYGGVPMFPKLMERIGDADGDSEVNASDAADILIIAVENGAGARHAVTFSADVNADGEVNAQDAAAVLVYAAEEGSGKSPDWQEILSR